MVLQSSLNLLPRASVSLLEDSLTCNTRLEESARPCQVLQRLRWQNGAVYAASTVVAGRTAREVVQVARFYH